MTISPSSSRDENVAGPDLNAGDDNDPVQFGGLLVPA